MCGVTGLINKKLTEKEESIRKMTDRILHRGPDDSGYYVDENVALGMRRLSIIDLSTGKQPIFNENNNLLIFFNGEIYNYKELYSELVPKYKFKTQSDTEVILHMYEEYGEKMLTKLRGMFVIVIYNIVSKEVFIARDFFGIKPLYYLVNKDKTVAFSSEIKSFLEYPGYKPEVNNAAVYNYLSFQYNPLAETFFKNVFKLPPGHFMLIDSETGMTKIERFWSFSFDQNPNLDEKETKRRVGEVMEGSVGHHMIADVPVGSFLSGGIDSSIIATLMQKIRGDKKIKTFTVGFNTLTEGKEAKETSSFLGTDHTEITIGPDEYFSVLPKIVYHFDEPIADPSAVGLYFVAKEAGKSVKVVLSGEGSDELFGGYNIYLAPFAKNKMTWIPRSILNLFLALPFNYFGKNYLKRVSNSLEKWYIGNANVFDENEIKKLWKSKDETKFSLRPLYRETSSLSESTQMQFIDINTWLIGDILAKADKMTMASSLELRVPFLDILVSDLARTIPDKLKWNKGITKYILRQAFENIIPENTRNRRKLGFPTPVRDWLTKERKNVYELILQNEYIKSNFNTNIIERIISEQTEGLRDNSRKIYTLLMLALWYNVFIKES